jgi:hypothetical protein
MNRSGTDRHNRGTVSRDYTSKNSRLDLRIYAVSESRDRHLALGFWTGLRNQLPDVTDWPLAILEVVSQQMLERLKLRELKGRELRLERVRDSVSVDRVLTQAFSSISRPHVDPGRTIGFSSRRRRCARLGRCRWRLTARLRWHLGIKYQGLALNRRLWE